MGHERPIHLYRLHPAIQMSTNPIVLAPVATRPGSAEYDVLLSWPFNSNPFFEGQVLSILQHDIPERFEQHRCSCWIYYDATGQRVGFGTLDITTEYADLMTDDMFQFHTYIPVLAVHTDFRGKGYGRWIVEHLIEEANVLIQNDPTIARQLFLDVYEANRGAINLYERSGFIILNQDDPIEHAEENNERYFVMAINLRENQTPP